jgi:diguanylate cyclase (GGDEF)-like protein
MLPNTNSEIAMQIAERIRRKLASLPLAFLGNSIRITASFGVAGTDLVGKTNLEDLIKMADNALYDAKRKGRNCTILFASGLS